MIQMRYFIYKSKMGRTGNFIITVTILTFFVIKYQFIQAQIAFKPPISMWDTWIFENENDYHLFYLNGFEGNIGRAVSDDMIHWKTLPTIINMSKKGDWDEYGMIMTGNTQKHGDKYFMSYGSGRPGINIGFLVSKDLINWERYSKNPVILPKLPYQEDTEHWRDLNTVYDQEKKQWDGYLFGIYENTNSPSIAHITSKDYLKWNYETPIFISEPYTRQNDGFVYLEVPDVFKMGDWYYIIFSSIRSRKEFTSGRKDASGTWYLIGKSKYGPFEVPNEPLLLGYGNGRNDTYVGHTIMFKGQRLFYHHTWGDFSKVTLATPKLLYQNANGTLELRFWENLTKLENKLLFEKPEIILKVNEEDSRSWEIINGIKGKDIMITGKIRMNDIFCSGITWHFRDNKANAVCFYPHENKITIGEVNYVNSFYAKTIKNNIYDEYYKDKLFLNEFHIRIMIRLHMVEVYINDKMIFATAMLNTQEEGGGIGFWSEKGELQIKDFKVSELELLK